MKTSPRSLTRRHVLRGAGLALALPWLESLAPKPARGQAVTPPRRFVPVYFPLGTADYWMPKAAGRGDAWALSPLLAPLAPVKSRVTVLGHVDQTVYKTSYLAAGNGLLTGSFLTGAKCSSGFTSVTNGVSIDQRVAQALHALTPVPSLQLGLSTRDSDCDGASCAYSRSISWKDATTPLYKLVDPQAVFDTIVGMSPAPDGAGAARRAARKSVLDFVLANATSLSRGLGSGDRARLDEFLTAVRDLEMRVGVVGAQAQCKSVPRPTWSASVLTVPADYSRDKHADVMIDLIVMALSCDVTRVVSFMLDDARSDFPYAFLTTRQFSDTGSTPGAGPVSSPISAANSGKKDNGWATIDWWYVSKVSRLCQAMAAVPEGATTLLDNSVVWFGSGQQGEGETMNLPVLYVGGGGGALPVNRFVDFAPSQSLSNVYLTFLRSVFGAPDTAFGDSTGVVDLGA